jgi:hypothetical protein
MKKITLPEEPCELHLTCDTEIDDADLQRFTDAGGVIYNSGYKLFTTKALTAIQRLPTRHSDEGLADFAARVGLVLDVHLTRCNPCNYDVDCQACASGVSDPDVTHACNCTVSKPPGYGVQLRRLFEDAREAAAREYR